MLLEIMVVIVLIPHLTCLLPGGNVDSAGVDKLRPTEMK